MYKIRRISKYAVIGFVLVSSIYLIIVMLLSEPKEYSDNKYKLGIIEEAIRSNVNGGICRIPNLPVYSPEMMAFLKDEPPIDCGNEDDWVTCSKSVCFIKNTIIETEGKITCDFTEILRKDDYTIKYGKTHRSSSKYYLEDSDYVRVKCWTNTWENYWSGIVIGIRENLNRIIAQPQSSTINRPKLNVLMYGFDSLSKNAFIRKLPKTYDYLVKQLNGDILEGYNIVGDGTPQALIPILTGYTELELPETRKRMKDSKYVNIYPLIWKDYEAMGYVTAFNEDIPSVGTFSYRLNGFDEQPTDQYMRTYYLAIESELGSYRKLCVGHEPRHKVMMDYTTQFMTANPNLPHFAFSFHGELSHDSINLIGVADNDITMWLQDLHSNGILNDTILIMMSDHGNRFAKVRDTLQGKLEERLPFFSFIFPPWFKHIYTKEYENFKANLNSLVTPFDIHATLQHILHLQPSASKMVTTKKPIKKHYPTRAISLFQRIPIGRSCADAYIEPHWCVCLNWHQINDTKNDEHVYAAARAIVNKLNELTSTHRKLCAILRLHEIKWAAKLAPHDNLLRFKQNKDFDGFLPDLTSLNTKVSSEMYQIKLTVKPGLSIFEASVTHDLQTNKFVVQSTDISRVNKYGMQAMCILESEPELRKYCYCNEQHNMLNMMRN